MELEDRIIYLTRDSFCMADDVMAPNMYKFTWRDSDWCPETHIFGILEEYLGSNLPGYFWRGYSGRKAIVDVNLHRGDLSFTREIKLEENWRELLRENRTIHFLHNEYSDRDKLPIILPDSEGYSFEKAEQTAERLGSRYVRDRSYGAGKKTHE